MMLFWIFGTGIASSCFVQSYGLPLYDARFFFCQFCTVLALLLRMIFVLFESGPIIPGLLLLESGIIAAGIWNYCC